MTTTYLVFWRVPLLPVSISQCPAGMEIVLEHCAPAASGRLAVLLLAMAIRSAAHRCSSEVGREGCGREVDCVSALHDTLELQENH